MKRLTRLVLLLGCVILGAWALTAAWRPEDRVPQPTVNRAADGHDAQVASLTVKVDELEHALAALGQQQGAHESNRPPSPNAASEQTASGLGEDRPTREQVEARFKEYMADVARSFESEKSNPAWAKQASSQVAAAFAADSVLRDAATDIECREHTCRVQIDDTDRTVSPRMPSIAAQIGKTLPSIRADRIDQGNGRAAMVLYMSTKPFPRPASQ